MLAKITLAIFFLFLTSCATKFTGNAHIEKRMCQNKCAEQGMALSAMVFMGEYSSGCVCENPNRNASLESEIGASLGAVIGVVNQMREDEKRSGAMSNPM